MTSASLWFEKIWKRASVVDEIALDQAQRAWGQKARRGGPPGEGRPPDPASLFDAVARDRERFRGVGFVFTTGNATTKDRDEAVEAVIKKDKELKVPLLSPSDRKALGAWPVGDLFSNWDHEDIYAWPQRFVCAHRRPNGRFSYWFYERVHTVILEGERGMLLARRPGMLRKELGFKRGAVAMAAVDEHRASLIFDRIAESGHQLYESGEKLAELLAELPAEQ